MTSWVLLTQRTTNQKQIDQTLTNFVRELYCQRNHRPGLANPVITQALKQPREPRPPTSRKEAKNEGKRSKVCFQCGRGDNGRRAVLPESQNQEPPDGKPKTSSSSLLPQSGPVGLVTTSAS